MPHLLLISIGPVQEFIAAARRSRDLWYGSRLLSELAKTVARTIAQEAGIESLIFPAPASLSELDQDSELDVANKIVATVESDPAGIAERAHRAMRAYLASLASTAFESLSGRFDRDTAMQQVADLPEVYWVSIPYGDNNDYHHARRAGERLLAFRKNTRDFVQVPWAANVPKSSLDGARESVIDERMYPTPRDDEAVKRRKLMTLYDNYRISGAERLSGVDLLKRRGRFNAPTGIREGAEFLSTSHMAALPLLNFIVKYHRDEWQQYLAALGTANWARLHGDYRYPHSLERSLQMRADGSVLFARRLQEQLEESGAEESKVERVSEELRRFRNVIGYRREPSPYYALLLGDGDSMGETLNNLKSPGQHRAFSQQLGRFAQQARNIVREHDGAILYAGGDDVLALLPLHTALEAAGAIAGTFREAMDRGEVEGEEILFRTGTGRAPTFSAGLVVVHLMEPLSDALALVRESEKKAKRHESNGERKNALAITSSKRSGADRTVVGHWDELLPHIQRLARFHQEDLVPDGAAYELQAVVLEVGGVEALRADANLRDAVRLEAIRILGRKRAKRGQEQLQAEILDALYKRLERTGPESVMQTAQELVIARVFADARREAAPFIKEVQA